MENLLKTEGLLLTAQFQHPCRIHWGGVLPLQKQRQVLSITTQKPDGNRDMQRMFL